MSKAANREEAEALLAKLVTKYEKCTARLANWLEASIPEGLTVFAFPPTHRRRIRTDRVTLILKILTKANLVLPTMRY